MHSIRVNHLEMPPVCKASQEEAEGFDKTGGLTETAR